MAGDILSNYPEGTHSRCCDVCSTWFLALSAKAAFCSGRCRAVACRRRKREGAERPTEKLCFNCRELKPLSEFYDRSDGPGKKPECKSCFNLARAAHRRRHPEVEVLWRKNNPQSLKRSRRRVYVKARSELRGWLMINLTTRRQQCRKAGIEFTLTVDQALALYESQEGLCALTGRELKWGVDSNRGPDTLSVDRIEAVGAYVITNVRLVTHWANVARQRLTDDEFRRRCLAVVEMAAITRSAPVP